MYETFVQLKQGAPFLDTYLQDILHFVVVHLVMVKVRPEHVV
jgi:hypothetical protein